MHVDVVLPTFNPDIERLGRAVSSILYQEDINPHLIIVDDSDNDSVVNYVKRTASDLTYLKGPGTTLAAALNEGVAAGDAPLVARHDADDVSLSQRLKNQRQRFQWDENLDLLGTGATIVGPSGDESRRRVKEDLRLDDFVGGNPIIHGSVMFRREAFEAVNGYDGRFSTTEDLELWIRMAKEGMRLQNMDTILYKLYLHEDSVYADQLRDTKLMGHFAEEYARGRINNDTEERVLNDGDIESVYTAMSHDDRCQFHQDVAIELLRYGSPCAAQDHIIRSLGQNWTNVIRWALLMLSFAPQVLTDSIIDMYRIFINRQIKQANN